MQVRPLFVSENRAVREPGEFAPVRTSTADGNEKGERAPVLRKAAGRYPERTLDGALRVTPLAPRWRFVAYKPPKYALFISVLRVKLPAPSETNNSRLLCS